MPQMNPMPWLTLFLFFIILMTAMQSLNYFNFPPLKIKLHKILTKTESKWKW